MPRALGTWTALAIWAAAAPLAAQPAEPPPAAEDPAGQVAQAPAGPRRVFASPYEAYEAGAYDQALQKFVDRQVERPEDPELALNIGAVHYRMRNYGDAEKVFSRAGLTADPELRQAALYNLGNTAYRQGRLEEAVELYKLALELDPDDEDAKFNLEFVRDEIRRRHEEAQKRQQQQQQGDSQEQPQEQQDGQSDSSEQQPQEGQQSPSGADEEPEPQDSDGDGLSDDTERQGDNPTDPQNPDTDGDSLLDGEEDLDRNGRLDEGETDPNRPDSDGDGVPDGEEEDRQAAAQPGGLPEETGQMSQEEAERYLQALQEGRPAQRQPRPGKRVRSAKDW